MNAAEVSKDGPHAEALLAKTWWRFEALYERWKQHMAHETDEHDPRIRQPDVPRGLDEKDVISALRLASAFGWHYHEGHKGCDDNGIKKWVAVATGALFVAFIVGGWSLSNQVSSMNAMMVAGFNEQNRRFSEQNDRISRLEIKTERMKNDP